MSTFHSPKFTAAIVILLLILVLGALTFMYLTLFDSEEMAEFNEQYATTTTAEAKQENAETRLQSIKFEEVSDERAQEVLNRFEEVAQDELSSEESAQVRSRLEASMQ